jgi:biopolymer transport protein ExbD
MALASVRQGTIPLRRYRENSEINVTPFVDILLVLLIVLMIAAPLVTTAILVENPPAPQAVPTHPIFVSLSESGEIYIARLGGAERLCAWSEVPACLKSLAHGNVSERINVRADPGVRYGEVVRLMDTVKGSGFEAISVVSEETEQP